MLFGKDYLWDEKLFHYYQLSLRLNKVFVCFFDKQQRYIKYWLKKWFSTFTMPGT